VISTVWAAVFVVLVLADLARLFILAVPHWLDTAVGISGMVIATKFTKWYRGECPWKHWHGRDLLRPQRARDNDCLEVM
jgi:hypothetical protein